MSIAALAIAALALLAFAPLTQAKTVVGGFGTSDSLGFGGQFQFSPLGVAVNNSGTGAARGTTYVVDSASRIQRFSPTGAFERAFGQDVIATTVNEQQRVTIKATGGTYTLSFKGFTTDPILFDANSFTMGTRTRDALAALPSVNGSANLNVQSSSNRDTYFFTVTFQGALAASDQPPITIDPSSLTYNAGTGTGSVTQVADGVDSATTGGSSTGFEICRVSTHCKNGSTSGTTANGGQLNSPQGVAIDPATGNVYVTEQSNRRVSEFDADGNFLRTWGWDVISTGRPGDLGTAAFEVCTVAADCKQAAANGFNGGQFNSQIGYPVVDASSNVWIPDAANRRIQEFDASGNFIAAYGYGVNGGAAVEACVSTAAGVCRQGTSGSDPGKFSNNNPRDLDFDNLGNVYALDSGNSRVQRFDPTVIASVSNFGTATFPTYTTSAPEHLIRTIGGTRLVFSINNNVSGGGERQLLEIDPTDASVKDTSLVRSGLTNVGGLGVNTTSGDLFATTSSSASTRSVVRLSSTPLSPPAPAMNAVTAKSDTIATLRGTVDPRGGLVTCSFEYSTDSRVWNSVSAPDCASLLENGGIQAVGEPVFGLTPNTHYFARLSVSRPLVPSSTVTSNTVEFDTDAPPPGVSVVGAFDVQDTTVRMGGTIDPKNSPTGYVFEYGTTAALGQSTAPLDIGGGTTPVVVSQLIRGLTPDTTYHFRLRATNASGDTAISGGTFHTRADAVPPPDNRAYEMVSPPDKNGGDVNRINTIGEWVNAAPAPDGNSLAFCTSALFGDPAPQIGTLQCAGYLSRRTPAGWQTKGLFPRFCLIDTVSGEKAAIGPQSQFLSADLSRIALSKYEPAGCDIPRFDPLAPFSPEREVGNLYLQDPDGDVNDPSSYQLLAPQSPAGAGAFVDASDDFSHIFYRSGENQTDPPDSPAPGAFRKLYEWIEPGPDCDSGVDPSYDPAAGGCLRLASVRPDGTPFTTSSSLPAIDGANSTSWNARNAVSADGSRIYFNNTAVFQGSGDNPLNCGFTGITETCQIYMREDGTTTYQVSESECTVDCDPIDRPALFQWATPDGAMALFSSGDKLSDDAPAGGGLYRWDSSQPAGARLTALGYSAQPLGMSDDGETIYTYADGDGISNGIKRWQWNGGTPTVDVLGQGDRNGSDNDKINARYARDPVTPDGRYLVLNVDTPLDPVADKDTDRDIYRWDEQNGWVCVSCQLPEVASLGHSTLSPAGALSGPVIGNSRSLFNLVLEPMISPDGRRIFFTTSDALVPEDVNAEGGCVFEGINQSNFLATRSCSDVYEWNDGRLSLISSGTHPHHSYLLGTDHTGNRDNVFFYTSERLVGWDVDDNYDLYTARIGGGLPEPPAQPPGCEGEACRGAGPDAGDVPGAGSSRFEGQGNPRELIGNTCGRFSKKAQRKQKAARKAARKGQAKRARALRKQANNLNRRAKRCNRRAGR